MNKYALGADFGTESVRVALIDTCTGEMVGNSVVNYRHGVIREHMPDSYGGAELKPGRILQHPGDYIESFVEATSTVLQKTGVKGKDVVGAALDGTACTMLFVDADGRPLCYQEEFRNNPHAYAKLWADHASQKEVNEIDEAARKSGETGEYVLFNYGGMLSNPEWFAPKFLNTFREAPEVVHSAHGAMHLIDYLTMSLTGKRGASISTAGFKGMYTERGFPPQELFGKIDPEFARLFYEKTVMTPLYRMGERWGELTKEMADQTGLVAGTPIGVPIIDAHTAIHALGASEPGIMVAAMGTSTCEEVLSRDRKCVEGMCGVVKDGITPELYAYEFGQANVGSLIDWYVNNLVSEKYMQEARQRGMDIHVYLEEKASALRAGESGIITPPWFSNVRALERSDLAGAMLGLRLDTKPEQVYLALIESTAYELKGLIESCKAEGMDVNELRACGGISEKNRLFMQTYADIIGMPIRTSSTPHASARGAAILAAVAAGDSRGRRGIEEAMERMADLSGESYDPRPENSAVYGELYRDGYREWCRLVLGAQSVTGVLNKHK